MQRFDKCLEEFYALCDQLELCLVRGLPDTEWPPLCLSPRGPQEPSFSQSAQTHCAFPAGWPCASPNARGTMLP